MSEVENNLDASFVILGLVASVPYLDENIWIAFTQQTLFLRPHVQSLAYGLWVLPDQRAAVEKKYNGTFHTFNNSQVVPRGPEAEYAPVIYVSANETSYMIDLLGYPILGNAIVLSRNTGKFALSAPYLIAGTWHMAAFLPNFGDYDPLNLTTIAARQAACVGYVVTVLSVEEVLGSVISRYVTLDIFIL